MGLFVAMLYIKPFFFGPHPILSRTFAFQDSDLFLKSKLLSALAKELDGHAVPNSMLHSMSTLDKVMVIFSKLYC